MVKLIDRAFPRTVLRRAAAARGPWALLLAGALPFVLLTDAHAKVDVVPGVFNTTVVRSDGLKPFPKWTSALERYINERKNAEGECGATTFNKCSYQKWQVTIDGLRGKSPMGQLKGANKFANKARYILDSVNWGVKDYWESPGQFFRKDGDCEDYAIVKFLTLRRLGWKNDDLRIVVLRDVNLKIAHAVLAVKYKKKNYILDNQMTLVVLDTRIRHYKPIYSVNEEAWWRYRPVRKKRS